jgi:hypothetical protein
LLPGGKKKAGRPPTSEVPTRGQVFRMNDFKGLAVGVYRALRFGAGSPHPRPLPTAGEVRRIGPLAWLRGLGRV